MEGFYCRQDIGLEQVRFLHDLCSLKTPENVRVWFGLIEENTGQLVGVAGLHKGLIQGIGIHPSFQGLDLTAQLLTALIDWAQDQGEKTLYIYTKPDNASKFEGFGFRRVLEVRPYTYLLEWGERALEAYVQGLEMHKREVPNLGSIVVNCNPFTLGHQYLINYAASCCDHLYIFVVQEEASLFSFQDRLEMIVGGTQHLKNITILPTGPYLVSALTFPAYFTRDADYAAAQVRVDVSLFQRYIAKVLKINKRFVGTEPFSPVTDLYNQGMQQILEPSGIALEIVPRKELGGEAISASRVRRWLIERDWKSIEQWVPKTTLDFLKAKAPMRQWQTHQGYIEDQRPVPSGSIALDAILAAREDKSRLQLDLSRQYGQTLMSIALNIPGSTKYKSTWKPLLDAAFKELSKTLKALQIEISFFDFYPLETGAYWLIVAPIDASQAKTIAVAIEERYPHRRLVDLDVIDGKGNPVSRESLGLAPRKCFICNEPAKLCMRQRTHTFDDVMTQVNQWLAVLVD